MTTPTPDTTPEPQKPKFPNCTHCNGMGTILDTTYDRTGVDTMCGHCEGTGLKLPRGKKLLELLAALNADGDADTRRRDAKVMRVALERIVEIGNAWEPSQRATAMRDEAAAAIALCQDNQTGGEPCDTRSQTVNAGAETQTALETQQPVASNAAAHGPIPAPAATSRDWAEDFRHENGNYNCKCVKCGEIFTGHKRRMICKLCAATPSALADFRDLEGEEGA